MHHAPYKTVFRSTPQSHYHNWMSAFKEKEVLKNCWTGVSFHIFISTRFRVPSLIYFDLLVILPQLLYYTDCCAASECTCRKLMKRWVSKVDWFRCGVDNENIDSHCSRNVKNPVTIFFPVPHACCSADFVPTLLRAMPFKLIQVHGTGLQNFPRVLYHRQIF